MNTPRFSLSESDGHLYRDGNASPLRTGVAKWHTNITTVAELKATIRAADRAFGGVSLVLLTDDGACLCAKCARTEFRYIADAISDKASNGWRVVAATMDNELEACDCEHCGAVIVEDTEAEEFDEGHNEGFGYDDQFTDADPWRGGPEGDLYG